MKAHFQAKLRAEAARPTLLGSSSAIVRAAVELPVGPSFISDMWASLNEDEEEGEDGVPALVTVVVTRVTAWGSLIPAFLVIDRTCLGVKSAFLGAPRTRAELEGDLAELAETHGVIEECDLIIAQSVVLHAVDYARSLGFEPPPEFPEAFFSPRPDVLLDTPFSKPSYPIYIVGPGEPVEHVLETLDHAVGPFNYAFMPGEALSLDSEALSSRGEALERRSGVEEEASVAVG
jgi:hypothetical protein